jgi:hypothetical protein
MSRLQLALVALLAALPGLSTAQETTGVLTGTVRDASGGVLPSVTIVVTNVRTGVVRELATTAAGRYTAAFLPVGLYELEMRLAGFRPFRVTEIALHVNDRLEIDATLPLDERTDAVEVRADARLVQSAGSVQSLMAPAQVQELPLNNRNFVQLATLAPGVTSALPDEAGIGLTSVVSLSFAGSRRNAVNWFVDGASIVDAASNITLLATPSLESIEEFKIITSSYAAEWPRSGGGIVNVVTKSGDNRFRASAYEFFRHDALNANSFFRKQSSDPAIAGAPPRLRYHNFGYTLGGPIQRDRLFVFWSQEWRRISRSPTTAAAQVPAAEWLTDPANPNYVVPAARDANAVRLLSGWPAPNLGSTRFQDVRANRQDTRQEVIRLDWHAGARWRVMGRYTHDTSDTTEAGGLFFNTALPDIATTRTAVPGQVAVLQATTILGPRIVNDLSLQYSGNAIRSVFGDDVRNTREQYGLALPELFPENRSGLIPTMTIAGLSSLGAPQLFDNQYRNITVSNSVAVQAGVHAFKAGAMVALESKNELSTAATQGTFAFQPGGGRTAFQNFLTGNADGRCGESCSYLEPEREIASRLRSRRYELYVQDSWKLQPRLTVDVGVRYALPEPVRDENDRLTNFDPRRFDPTRAPRFADATGSALVAGTGDPLNGVVVAGDTSPHGRSIYARDTNNLQPRVGLSWDARGGGRTVLRGGFGIYFDQVLTGIFLQNAFVNPPANVNATLLNPRLSDPGAGFSPTTRPVAALMASSDPFDTPRTRQWNVGVQHQLYARGVVDVGYVGSAGDHLIQPVDINQPQPGDVVRLGGVNVARPYPGWAAITRRQTTARSRYHGLLVGFRHDAGRAGLVGVAYTLSRLRASATNDRDAIDLPQNPLDLEAEYAVARTDRTHVLSVSYVYELPFFNSSAGLVRAALAGWQLSGITQVWSGPPISRVVNGGTDGGRRGSRVDAIGDPRRDLPPSPPGSVYWFNPAAFAPPAPGEYGSTARAAFRLPGVHQWDVALSKSWTAGPRARMQLRAELINAFNHTQLDPTAIQNVCTVAASATSCAGSTGDLGQITRTRAPREIQLGLRVTWH